MRRLSSHFRAALCTSLLALSSQSGIAQVVTGRVYEAGTHAAIPDAAVTIADSSASRARVVRSSGNGQYRLKLIAAGTFIVAVRRIGFRPFTSSTVRVAEGDSVIIDVALEAVPQNLPTVTIDAELEAAKDLKVLGYNARSLPASYLTQSEIDALGKNAHTYLDIMRRVKWPSVRVDEWCVQDSASGGCLTVYLNDMLVGSDPQILKDTQIMVDPNAIDHIVYLRSRDAVPDDLRGTLHIYTRDYTERQRQHLRSRLAK